MRRGSGERRSLILALGRESLGEVITVEHHHQGWIGSADHRKRCGADNEKIGDLEGLQVGIHHTV